MANVFSQLSSQIASWFRQQQTTIIGRIGGTTEVYPNIDSTTAITKGFEGNAAVYSIIKKDAKKFGSIPRYVEKPESEGKAVEIISGDLQKLLDRPNENQSQDAFFALARAFYKTCGEAFIWLNRGDTSEMVENELTKISDEQQAKKPVLEMYVLPSNKVNVVPDPDNLFGVYGYILESNVRVPIRKVDIIHWKDLNLSFDAIGRDHLRGMSAMLPGRKTLEQNNSATNASVRMYQNDGAKGALVNKTMAKMTPTQETQLREVIDNKINNNDVKGAVAALQGDYNYFDISKDSVDMELLKGKEMSMKELCFLFGLPYALFDSEVTFDNQQMAQKGWVINEIMPDCKQLDGEFNRVLLPAFNMVNKGTICSDFDDLPELQEDKGKQAEWLMKIPYITPNQILEALGYPKRTEPEFDQPWVPQDRAPADEFLAGDMGQQLLNQVYANGGGNTGNGVSKVPQNGRGA